MPTLFCPGCGKSISAEEKATGFCPGCGKVLPGPTSVSAPPPPPRPVQRERPAVAHPEPEDLGITRSVIAWGSVRAGLGQTVVGAIISSLSLLVFYVINITAVEGGGTSALPVTVGLACGVIAVVGIIVALAGMFLGCAAPADSGARGWAFATSTLLVLVCVLGAVFFVGFRELQKRERAVEQTLLVGAQPHLGAPAWTPDEVQRVLYFACGAFVLAVVCYLLFLRAVAAFFHRNGLALGVVCYLVFLLLSLAGLLVLVTGALDPGALPVGGTYLPYLFIAVGVTLGVWGVVLVGMVRGAVTQGMLQS